jgi:hypothetical protein
MLDGGMIATGVATSVVTQKGMESLDNATRTAPSHEETVEQLLTDIRDAIAPPEKTSIEFPMMLQGYPSEYIIPDDFNERAHVCIFFFVVTAVRFDSVFGGTILKNEGPGWVQLDLPGRISTSDASQKFVTISYRNDPIGVSF